MNEDKTDVVGWLLAWLPEGGSNYNFEFFQEKSTSDSPCLYMYTTFQQGECDYLEDLTALQRATVERDALLQGQPKKMGIKVADAYVVPVIARLKP
jgi:hypothetical protein